MHIPPSNQPLRVSLTNEYLKGRKGEVTLSTGENEKIAFKILAENRSSKLPTSKLRVNTVPLKVTNAGSGKEVEVFVKISDLAKELGVGTEVIKEHYKSGQIEEFVKTKLRESSFDVEEHGLSEKDYTVIASFWKENREAYERAGEPAHIRKSEENGLPRSLVFIPKGRHQGLYILKKSKGEGVEERGVGSFNRATDALNFQTGELKVFRTAQKEDVPEIEIMANRLYARLDPDGKYFATGVPVFYTGPWRPRGVDRIGLPKSKVDETYQKLENVEKVGFIMDYIPGGDLYTLVWEDPERFAKLTEKQKVGIALKIAKAVAKAQEKNFVNYDIKLENIALDGEDNPILMDFGKMGVRGDFSDKIHTTVHITSPEMYNPWLTGTDHVTSQSEIWQLGILFLQLLKHSHDIPKWIENSIVNYEMYPSKEEIRNTVIAWFADRNKEGYNIDKLIAGCLEYYPEDRLTIEQVVEHLTEIERSLPIR